MHINYARGERRGQYGSDKRHVWAVPTYYRRMETARARAKEAAQMQRLRRSTTPEDVILPRLRQNARYDYW